MLTLCCKGLKPFLLIFLLPVFLLSACGQATPGGMSGTITITYPPPGTVVYASALHVAGMVSDAPEKIFLVRLNDASGMTHAEARVETKAGAWSVDLVHGFSGDPTSVRVVVVPADDPTQGIYASSEIILAALEHRPEGAYVDVMSPGDGAEVGGDSIQVEGRVSGVDSYRLELVGSDGTMIDSKTVELDAPYLIDDVPFTAELATNNFTGTALLKIYAGDELIESRTLIMSSAAG